MSRLNDTIDANNAKVRARRTNEITWHEQEIARLERNLKRLDAVAYVAAFVAVVALVVIVGAG